MIAHRVARALDPFTLQDRWGYIISQEEVLKLATWLVENPDADEDALALEMFMGNLPMICEAHDTPADDELLRKILDTAAAHIPKRREMTDQTLPTFDEAITMDAYQEQALTTAQYPEQGTGSALALAYVGLGLGEAGEIQGKIKKVLRDSGGVLSPETRRALLAEYGDILWYVAVGVSELGATLEEVAAGNLKKLADRKARGVIQGSGDNR